MRFRLASRAIVIGVAAVLALSACGGSEPADTAQASGGGGLEKAEITIGALPIPDSAALYIANKRGFFKEEGLTVNIETVQGGAQAQQSLMGGSLDATQTNYVSTFLAVSAGNKLKIVADLYQATPNSFNIMVPKDSPSRPRPTSRARRSRSTASGTSARCPSPRFSRPTASPSRTSPSWSSPSPTWRASSSRASSTRPG
nr:hypothetical protein GCM10020093_099600 [Planobispora longispora]